jgi:hypothetical protein
VLSRLPVLSAASFRTCVFERVRASALLSPDTQFFLRVAVCAFNATYADLRAMFRERGVPYLTRGDIGI